MKRILAAVDGSERALKALEFASRLAGETKAELTILTVTQEMPISDQALREYAKAERLAAAWGDLSEARATEILSAAEGRVPAGGPRVHPEWRVGDPAAEILRFAKEAEADTIVMGHAGHSRVMGVLLGSVAFKVVTHAPCPVVVVPD
ncbi:MAG TPA: universal stress protein [Stellaceae bacterium]|nr:universal stress protein [Stellaceae bacterium]